MVAHQRVFATYTLDTFFLTRSSRRTLTVFPSLKRTRSPWVKKWTNVLCHGSRYGSPSERPTSLTHAAYLIRHRMISGLPHFFVQSSLKSSAVVRNIFRDSMIIVIAPFLLVNLDWTLRLFSLQDLTGKLTTYRFGLTLVLTPRRAIAFNVRP